MKHDRLLKSFLFDQPFRIKWKAGRLPSCWEDIIKKYLKEMRAYWDGVKKEALNRLGRRRNVRSCVDFRGFVAAVSC